VRPAASAVRATCNNSWNLLDSRSHSSYHSQVWGAACVATLPSGQGNIPVTTMGRSATGVSAPPCLVGGATFFLRPLGGAACPSECSDSEVVGTSGSNASGSSQGDQSFRFFSDVSVAGCDSDCREPAACSEISGLAALRFDDEALVAIRGVSLCVPLTWLSHSSICRLRAVSSSRSARRRLTLPRKWAISSSQSVITQFAFSISPRRGLVTS